MNTTKLFKLTDEVFILDLGTSKYVVDNTHVYSTDIETEGLEEYPFDITILTLIDNAPNNSKNIVTDKHAFVFLLSLVLEKVQDFD